ncbi:MAG: aspartyl protease family protein [Bacteroidales bacterium]|nr:aspartyl protease family protein [Bacteroidales bacterium]MDD3859544.1 aspartyl protease family protein [Bacteroidales bacterium]
MTDTHYKKYKVKLKFLKIDGGGTHLAVRAKINGVSSVLLIDTGASNTVFDSDNPIFSDIETTPADKKGAGSGFNSELPELVIGEIKSIKIARMEIKNLKVIFTSMNHINNLYKTLRLPSITGILGSDLLLTNNAIIDFGNKLIMFEKK